MKKARILTQLLNSNDFPREKKGLSERDVTRLQLKMLRIQQGVWHSKRRAIIVFEGFDAAGKGGAIRRLTKALDPRSYRVFPIGPPTPDDQAKHYLYRFWRDLPAPGTIAIFDRSWYGRVLVERVEELTPRRRWEEAYSEINEFEATLARDGINLVKIFLAIHPEEQLARFEARLRDPYKQWKLTGDDIEAHRKWNQYVKATDDLLAKTNSRLAKWHIVCADSKEYARDHVLKIVTTSLAHHEDWMESVARKKKNRELRQDLKELRKVARLWKK